MYEKVLVPIVHADQSMASHRREPMGREMKANKAGFRGSAAPGKQKSRSARMTVSGAELTMGAVGLALPTRTVHADEPLRERPDPSRQRGRRRRSNRPGNFQANGPQGRGISGKQARISVVAPHRRGNPAGASHPAGESLRSDDRGGLDRRARRLLDSGVDARTVT